MSVSDFAPIEVTPSGQSATTLPITGYTMSPNLNVLDINIAGRLFSSATMSTGGAPTVGFTMPAKEALDTFGLTVKVLTDIKLFFALFSNAERASGANHDALQASNGGYVAIQSITAGRGQIATANCIMIPISSGDTADPWTKLTSQSLPTLSAEPTLNTLGGIAVSGTRYDPLENITINLGPRLQPVGTNARYPQAAVYRGAQGVGFSGTHGDWLQMQTLFGDEGSEEADVDIYLRENDEANATLKTTGIELAFSDVFVRVQQLQSGRPNRCTIVGQAKSTSTTHPIGYTASATVP